MLRSNAAKILATYKVPSKPLFIVGCFDAGVTVFSQQSRALNLAWSLVETGTVVSQEPSASPIVQRQRIAIIGGGFAGLSVAAGLVRKDAATDITIFEARDTLLPLQQGSDSRWLHPRIYDWPSEGSEAAVAMLPVLNWTAARASDVVVNVLAEWSRIVEKTGPTIRIYCNTRHLQVQEHTSRQRGLTIEWIGEERQTNGMAPKIDASSAVGKLETFDLVILAVGFGLERESAHSYWRNETLGQPSLDKPRQTYLLSGQGDGAMIDLLRLRISQYRQDRILEELFGGKKNLLQAIERLNAIYSSAKRKSGLFDELEKLEKDEKCSEDFKSVKDGLSRRLRRDNEVILRLKVKKLSHLFDPRDTRTSFQNRVLTFFLYKCGGFYPSTENEFRLARQHSIVRDNIIIRHGTQQEKQIDHLLSPKLYKLVTKGRNGSKGFLQSHEQQWPGGYFGFSGTTKNAAKTRDDKKGVWRKEYVPGPTALLASSFCATLAGWLSTYKNIGKARLRVTLHRAVTFGTDELLQQICDYEGCNLPSGESAAGRTFPVNTATIGLAYRCRRIVRSEKGVAPEKLAEAMAKLSLHEASRNMSQKVGFVLAIPILEPHEPHEFTRPTPVAGVVFIDSETTGFYIDDADLRKIVSMIQSFVDSLTLKVVSLDRLKNVQLNTLGDKIPRADVIPRSVRSALSFANVDMPRTRKPFQFNFDYSDFTPVRERA